MSAIVRKIEKYFTDPILYIPNQDSVLPRNPKACVVCWEPENFERRLVTHGEGLHSIACETCLPDLLRSQGRNNSCPQCRDLIDGRNIYYINDAEEHKNINQIENAASLSLPSRDEHRRRQLLKEMIYDRILIPIQQRVDAIRPTLRELAGNTIAGTILGDLLVVFTAFMWAISLRVVFPTFEFSPDSSVTLSLLGPAMGSIMFTAALSSQMLGKGNSHEIPFGFVLMISFIYMIMGTGFRNT